MDGKLLLINGKEVLMSADEAFIQFEKLLKQAANKWRMKYEFDDMFQVACLGFTEAYKKYDAAKGYQFSTYLYSTVSGKLMRYNANSSKHLEVFSLNVASNNDETQEYIDNIADDTDFEELAINKVLVNQIDSLLGRLETQNSKIFKDYYMNKLTQMDIALKYDLSLNYVSRLIKSLLKVTTDYMNGNPIKEPIRRRTISQEQLLNEVQTYGTSKEAVIKIAAKYGVKPSTVQNKIYFYRMNQMKDAV